MEWSTVFKKAAAVAEKLRKQHPRLSVAEATKRAWKTREIKALKAAYKKRARAK